MTGQPVVVTEESELLGVGRFDLPDHEPRAPTKKHKKNKGWASNTYKDFFGGFTGESDLAYGRKQKSINDKFSLKNDAERPSISPKPKKTRRKRANKSKSKSKYGLI